MIKHQSVQVDSLPQVEGFYGIFAPVNQVGQTPEILFLLLADTAESRKPIYVVEKLLQTFRVCLQSLSLQQHDWKVNALSAVIELVTETENCQTVSEATELIVNQLSRHLAVGHVAIAKAKRGGVHGISISGISKIGKRSESHHAFKQCLSESVLRDEEANWPASNEANDQLLLAHRQLANQLNADAVFSCPLQTVEGKPFGAWLFAGNRELIDSSRLRRFVQVIAPRIVNALQAVERAQHPLWLRAIRGITGQLGKRKTQAGLLAFTALFAAMFYPMPYRIRCKCAVEPEIRRFAVAPFDGTVLKGFVKPGEKVSVGQLMAEMDGRSLRYELAEVVAKRNIASKQRAIELAERDIPEMLLAELDGKRLEAEQQLLKFKQTHLQIKSPIDGVVLAGSLERAEASAVRTGDILFEVGSLERVVIYLEIPAEDLPQVEIGQQVTVWIQGRESQPVKGTLQKVRPQSERRDAKNVFIGEFVLEEQDGLRPGMLGAARIDGHVNSLGWNLFHKPLDFLRSRLSW